MALHHLLHQRVRRKGMKGKIKWDYDLLHFLLKISGMKSLDWFEQTIIELARAVGVDLPAYDYTEEVR